MSVLWMENFENISTAKQLAQNKWIETGGSINTSIYQTGSRSWDVSVNSEIRRSLGSSLTLAGYKVGVRWANFYGVYADVSCPIFFADANGNKQVSLRVNLDGLITVRLGAADGTVIGTADSGENLVLDTFYNLEMEVGIGSDEDGHVYVWKNNKKIISLENITTVNTSSAEVSSVGSYVRLYSYVDMYIDNCVARDDAIVIGNRNVFTLLLTADVSNSGFTASSGGDLYADVDKTVPDAGATYIEAPDSGDVAQFSHASPNTFLTDIMAVATVHRSLKSDTGDCSAQASLTDGTNTVAGTEQTMTTDGFVGYQDVHMTAPDGEAWTHEKLVNSNLILERTE